MAWRHDLHQHPELSNEETRTAQLVAEHLRRLGLEVRTGVGGTGVVGVLRGGRPGPMVALRADMDALPVTEEASGTGPGGALAMLRDGVLENPAPTAIFGLHVFSGRVAEGIAQSAGATAEVQLTLGNGVTYNDPSLVERMRPTVQRVAGKGLILGQPTTTSEDFSAFQARVPGVFLFLGVTPEGQDLKSVAPNHSPRFAADDRALPVGVRLLANLAVDYLGTTKGK